jgi:hypothetical protein
MGFSERRANAVSRHCSSFYFSTSRSKSGDKGGKMQWNRLEAGMLTALQDTN